MRKIGDKVKVNINGVKKFGIITHIELENTFNGDERKYHISCGIARNSSLGKNFQPYSEDSLLAPTQEEIDLYYN